MSRWVWLCGIPSIRPGLRWASTSPVGAPLLPPLVEIACDESGSEGEHLIGGNTDVFAHASVNLSIDTSADCVREIRARIGSPALEYKANHLLREKHRGTLEWFLGPSSPLAGHAAVHLVDKTYLLLCHLTGDNQQAAALYRDGPRTYGTAQWQAFLSATNDRLRANPDRPSLDPQIPAIARAVDIWSAGGSPVDVIHDEQPVITEDRIVELKELLNGRLASLRLVDSRDDARVQVADFLAGIARKIASEERGGRADAALTALLRPYVDPGSLWVSGGWPGPGGRGSA
jgi:hypothetical protein